MKVLYTTEEGGHWKGMNILSPDKEEIFAICLPDGTIWDRIVGVDDIHRIKKDEFKKLYNWPIGIR